MRPGAGLPGTPVETVARLRDNASVPGGFPGCGAADVRAFGLAGRIVIRTGAK